LPIFAQTENMTIVYILLIAYIIAINVYAFILLKSLKAVPTSERKKNVPVSTAAKNPMLGKLLLTGALGGALTVYTCMFIFKYKRNDLLLMVAMPILGVLNVYLFILLFRAGMWIR
jgi:hypothetical protein